MMYIYTMHLLDVVTLLTNKKKLNDLREKKLFLFKLNESC